MYRPVYQIGTPSGFDRLRFFLGGTKHHHQSQVAARGESLPFDPVALQLGDAQYHHHLHRARSFRRKLLNIIPHYGVDFLAAKSSTKSVEKGWHP